jgi:UPF0716 protein FxsA
VRWTLAALLVLPVLEVVAAIEVGRWIGPLPTLALLLLISIAGAMLVRRQGAAAWRSLNRSLRAGEPPSKELADATVLVLAGVLLILPGFLTDVLAVLLLFPLTRPVARRPLERALQRAAANRVTLIQSFPGGAGRGTFVPGAGPAGAAGGPAGSAGSAGASPGAGAGPGRPRFGGDVVPGEVIDDEPPRPM